MPRKKIHSGFVSIVGRPSTGKSTFLNRILDQRVSIVSRHPQSTRNLIRGIYNTDTAQCVFLDTPGFNESKNTFNKRLRSLMHHSLDHIDEVLYFIDVTRKLGKEDALIQTTLLQKRVSVTAVINKCDIAHETEIAKKEQELQSLSWIKAVFRISATTAMGTDLLIEHVIKKLPMHEPYYPRDVYTDQDPSLRITEIIRHVCWNNLKQEIPYALYVEIQHSTIHHTDTGEIRAAELDVVVYVEQKSHIPIFVGKKGSKIASIRKSSEILLREIFPYPIHLHIQCKHAPKWRTNTQVLTDTIY